MKFLISSKTETEVGALFRNDKSDVPKRDTREEMGHHNRKFPYIQITQPQRVFKIKISRKKLLDK